MWVEISKPRLSCWYCGKEGGWFIQLKIAHMHPTCYIKFILGKYLGNEDQFLYDTSEKLNLEEGKEE